MTKQRSILVVEDEADLAKLLRYNIEREGYVCSLASDGGSALAQARNHAPDLILLDRMLPGTSGDEVITQLRQDTHLASIPVIMLTAKAEESDELVGLALGADDYISKPFSMKLVLARMAAVLRRAETPQNNKELLISGPIQLDTGRCELKVDDRLIRVTATEFGLLKTLMAANGRVLNRQRLIEAVLGTGVAVTDRTIDVHITALRKKLRQASGWIHTIRGIGYAFREPLSEGQENSL